MQLSSFINGDKKAIVVRKDYNYTVEYYIKDKIVSKEVTADYQKAEDLAEDFILAEDDKGGPTLLNEDA
jgi:hypothetical protein